MNDGSAVALSIGKYYTPNGISLEGVGIVPDVEIIMDDSAFADLYYGQMAPVDVPQVQAALEALK